MNLYAETSAVLAWLLAETAGPMARRHLGEADIVVSSDLTLVECHRSLHRAVAISDLDEAHAASLHGRLAEAARHWNVLRVGPAIVERARQSFPGEPIRSLDALHVASALHARAAVPDLALLSLDDRIRRVGRGLGLQLLPE